MHKLEFLSHHQNMKHTLGKAFQTWLNYTRLKHKSNLTMTSTISTIINVTSTKTIHILGQNISTKKHEYDEYEKYLFDIWIGIVLTFLFLSCVFCMCACFIYNKYQQWKLDALQRRISIVTPGRRNQPSRSKSLSHSSLDSLPDYTVVSGLPTYEEAIEKMRNTFITTANKHTEQLQEQTQSDQLTSSSSKLNILEIIQICKYKPTSSNSETNTIKV